MEFVLVVSKLMYKQFEPLAKCDLYVLSFKTGFDCHHLWVQSGRTLCSMMWPSIHKLHKDNLIALAWIFSQGPPPSIPPFSGHNISSIFSFWFHKQNRLCTHQMYLFYFLFISFFIRIAFLFAAYKELSEGLNLFVCISGPNKGWVVKFLCSVADVMSYPIQSSLHQNTFLGRLSLDDIYRAATWFILSTFLKHYSINVDSMNEAPLGKAPVGKTVL